MPGRNSYTSDEVESCRDACDALLAAWAANDIEDTTLEAIVFGQAVVVLVHGRLLAQACRCLR